MSVMESGEIEQKLSTVTTQVSDSASRLQLLAIKHTNFSEVFTDIYKILSELIVEIEKISAFIHDSPLDINLSTAQRCIEVLERYSGQINTAVETCERGKVRKRMVGEVQVVGRKLGTIREILVSAFKFPMNDLFSQPITTPRWQTLMSIAHIHTFPSPITFQKHLNQMIFAIIAGNAFVSKAYEKTGTSRKLMLGLGAVYYNIAKKKAMRKARISFANPNIEIAKAIWNLMDTRLMAFTMETLAMSIEVNTVIYVPRVRTQDAGEARSVRDSMPGGDLGEDAERLNPEFSLERREGWVKIRILSPFRIEPLRGNKTNTGCCGAAQDVRAALSVKSVIFHIHGGGFISMSSRSHQNYTRNWANSTQTVLFSVDYRLAPEFPYPAALEDVWNAYIWVVGYAKRYLSIDFDRIIVTGDSAGGNLACGLINRAIESGFPALVPHGALLTYPALYLAPNRYTPSFERALEDLIVHHTFLKLCLESYVPTEFDPTRDYFISPLLTPDANLQLFPPIRLMTGSADPLEDDSWRLAERLQSLGKDVQLIQFTGMPHGFLGFDMKVKGMREARTAVDQGSAFLKELMKLEVGT